MNRREKEEAFAYSGEFGCCIKQSGSNTQAKVLRRGSVVHVCVLRVACDVASAAKRKAQFAVLQVNSISIWTNASIGLTNSQIQMHLILISFATLINFRLQIIW